MTEYEVIITSKNKKFPKTRNVFSGFFTKSRNV